MSSHQTRCPCSRGSRIPFFTRITNGFVTDFAVLAPRRLAKRVNRFLTDGAGILAQLQTGRAQMISMAIPIEVVGASRWCTVPMQNLHGIEAALGADYLQLCCAATDTAQFQSR